MGKLVVYPLVVTYPRTCVRGQANQTTVPCKAFSYPSPHALFAIGAVSRLVRLVRRLFSLALVLHHLIPSWLPPEPGQDRLDHRCPQEQAQRDHNARQSDHCVSNEGQSSSVQSASLAISELAQRMQCKISTIRMRIRPVTILFSHLI